MMNKSWGKGCCTVTKVGWVLVLIGALNWGLIGLGGFLGGDWNVVGAILGGGFLSDLVYLLVGISGVMMITGCKCKTCKGGACGACANGTCSMHGGMKSDMDMHSADDGHGHSDM